MKEQLRAIAERIRGLRELLEISAESMAEALGLPLSEYESYESGERDFQFSFLYEVAKRLGVDTTEILTGEVPTLSTFSLIRKGEGLPVRRRSGFDYQHLAYLYKNRTAVPLYVTAKYDPELEEKPIELNRHKGQEFDYILEGKLKVKIDDHEFVMEPGDAIYYNSQHGHGMIAVGGQDCKFIAVLLEEIG